MVTSMHTQSYKGCFPSPYVRAQYVRIVPQAWQKAIAMRVELIGCDIKSLPSTSGSQPVDSTTELPLTTCAANCTGCSARPVTNSTHMTFR